MTNPVLKLGTRGSPLALAQARQVRDALAAAWPDLAGPGAVEIVMIKTSGDAIQDRALAEFGGKGLFTKELEIALDDGTIDLAVHSSKDMPTWLPPGLALVATMPREDVRDALIVELSLHDKVKQIADLPHGARLGTAALRRQAQLLHQRPDLEITLLRGSVGTRLDKVKSGVIAATLLAAAGLSRLGLLDQAALLIEPGEILPAVGQGAIGIEIAERNERAREFIAAINHAETFAAITAERAMLAVLDGSCRTPIGGWARRIENDTLILDGLIAAPDGSQLHRASGTAAVADAAALGHDIGQQLRVAAGPALLALII